MGGSSTRHSIYNNESKMRDGQSGKCVFIERWWSRESVVGEERGNLIF